MKLLYFIIITFLNIGLCLCNKIAVAQEIVIAMSKYGVAPRRIIKEKEERKTQEESNIISVNADYEDTKPESKVDSEPAPEFPKSQEALGNLKELMQEMKEERYQTKYGLQMDDSEWWEKSNSDDYTIKTIDIE